MPRPHAFARRAASYRFVGSVLEEAFGAEALAGLHRLTQEGPVGPPLSDELAFVDSAGVSVLIKAKQTAEASGGTLVLRRPTEQLERVFALVGLADWLAVED